MSRKGSQYDLTSAPTLGAYLPREVDGLTPCPICSETPERVWRPGGAFQQRTECRCGRVTRWVMCGHDTRAETTDDVPSGHSGNGKGKGGIGNDQE